MQSGESWLHCTVLRSYRSLSYDVASATVGRSTASNVEQVPDQLSLPSPAGLSCNLLSATRDVCMLLCLYAAMVCVKQ